MSCICSGGPDQQSPLRSPHFLVPPGGGAAGGLVDGAGGGAAAAGSGRTAKLFDSGLGVSGFIDVTGFFAGCTDFGSTATPAGAV